MTARDFLEIAGGDRPSLVSRKVDGLRKFLLAFGAARSWLWLIFGADVDATVLAASAVAFTGCAALAWIPRQAHWAARIAVPFAAFELVATFPLADNHFVLELVVLGLLAVVGAEGEAEAEALQGIAWVTAIVLFHTGLQKALHGQYFRGEFLAFLVGQGDRFADVFAWILPAADVERLRAYDVLRSGSGPFRVDSTTFVVLSNLVYVSEMVLAPLLVWQRTRVAAMVLTLGLVLLIQLGAREIGFALLFGNLLLSFAGSDVVRRLVPLWIALLAWVVLAALGVLPGGAWIDRGYM